MTTGIRQAAGSRQRAVKSDLARGVLPDLGGPLAAFAACYLPPAACPSRKKNPRNSDFPATSRRRARIVLGERPLKEIPYSHLEAAP
jgi:hypothetical protein